MEIDLIPIEISSEASFQDGAGKQHHTGGVTVRTEGMSLKASQAIATKDWVFLLGPVAIEYRLRMFEKAPPAGWCLDEKAAANFKSREFQAEGVFVRRSPGGLIEYWFRHLTCPDGKPVTRQDLLSPIPNQQ
jgi:hypothetical protein